MAPSKINSINEQTLHNAIAQAEAASGPVQPPKMRTKVQALLMKALEKRDQKKRAAQQQAAAYSLIFAAKTLHSDVKDLNTTAAALVERAKKYPKPAAPPDRSTLFQRPKDAPQSDYERKIELYNATVQEHHFVEDKAKKVEVWVSQFQQAVAKLTNARRPLGSPGKMELDLESLDNAGRNLQREINEVDNLLLQAKGSEVG